MENIYLYMIIALAILAVADLVVGVSNDAVNFLNSAMGSKAVSFRTLMIVASLGIGIGAMFSSGMMEIARKGIFNPEQFMFSEIMIIFMAVMLTDILLLDFFNSIGLPTSTTVSIVFELLGASVAMSLIKISQNGGSYAEAIMYINTAKVTEIIYGILLSVVIAFTIGAFVQWLARLFLSYNFERKANWIGAVFGGIALTSITYFIFIKGIGGTSLANKSYDIIGGNTVKDFLEQQTVYIVGLSLVFWLILSYILIAFLKTNIYKVIILVGTFALALAFAGNDLVNFIGPSMAAFQAYSDFTDPVVNSLGLSASEFSMSSLSEQATTSTLFLIFAGLVMVLTLWFSKKAKTVVQTSIDLSSQGETKERFQPNFLSRIFVRMAIGVSQVSTYILPKSLAAKLTNSLKPL